MHLVLPTIFEVFSEPHQICNLTTINGLRTAPAALEGSSRQPENLVIKNVSLATWIAPTVTLV